MGGNLSELKVKSILFVVFAVSLIILTAWTKICLTCSSKFDGISKSATKQGEVLVSTLL